MVGHNRKEERDLCASPVSVYSEQHPDTLSTNGGRLALMAIKNKWRKQRILSENGHSRSLQFTVAQTAIPLTKSGECQANLGIYASH